MQIECPTCGAQLAPEQFDFHRLIGRCTSCRSIFSLADRVKSSEAQPEVQAASSLPGFVITRQDQALTISRRWIYNTLLIIGAFVALVIIGTVLKSLNHVIASGNLWAIAGVTLSGSICVYLGFAWYLNATVITVTPTTLTVTHRPLPWLGNISLNVQEISQLSCRERIHRQKRSVRYTYEVHVLMRGRKRHKILGYLNTPEQAFYVEREIRRFLGL